MQEAAGALEPPDAEQVELDSLAVLDEIDGGPLLLGLEKLSRLLPGLGNPVMLLGHGDGGDLLLGSKGVLRAHGRLCILGLPLQLDMVAILLKGPRLAVEGLEPVWTSSLAKENVDPDGCSGTCGRGGIRASDWSTGHQGSVSH